MSLFDAINILAIKDGVSIGAIVLIFILSMIQVSKINWNPWDKVLNWFGTRFNKDLRDRIIVVEEQLGNHIQESEEKALRDTRESILDFANSCMNHRKHTKEEFEYIISQCDNYEAYIEKNNIKNGVISQAIAEIRRLYAKCIQRNNFLKEGEDHDAL